MVVLIYLTRSSLNYPIEHQPCNDSRGVCDQSMESLSRQYRCRQADDQTRDNSALVRHALHVGQVQIQLDSDRVDQDALAEEPA